MARTAPPDALIALRAATSIHEQIAALRRLKNDLIGHDQRKEACIIHGAAGLLVQLLNGALRAGGKRRRMSLNGSKDDISGNDPAQTSASPNEGQKSSLDHRWSDEDELRLQCTIVVGSLTQAGLAYVTPLVAAGITQPLLSALSLRESPARLVLMTLRTLLVCAEALATALDMSDHSASDNFADQLFSKQDVGALSEILSQRADSKSVDEQKALVTQLICVTCRTPAHQNTLLRAGVLDLLAGSISASVIAESPQKSEKDEKLANLLPTPPSKESLTHTLEAISAIIINSDYRCARLVYSPTIIEVFPIAKAAPSIASGPLFENGPTSIEPHIAQSESIDRLLPQLNSVQPKYESNFSKAFPALGSFAAEPPRGVGNFAEYPAQYVAKMQIPTRTTSQEFGTQLVSWLLYVARTTIAMDRLAAVWLLTLIVRAKDKIFPETAFAEAGPSRNRDRTLAYLLVPLIVRMVEETNDATKEAVPNMISLLIKERAMAALGMLVEDSPTLQKAAVDAGAIKLLSQILKKTFDPIVDRRRPMWSPMPTAAAGGTATSIASASTELGAQGLSTHVTQTLRCRAASLNALAQLGQYDDQFRKQMIETGIVACMVDSMTPYPTSSTQLPGVIVSNDDALEGKKGNPVPVLVAACNLARALSRSVNILRTSLIDGGLAKPVLELLQHPDIKVMDGATNVMCNLLLHFSPMRDELVKGDCIRLLCQHAHSEDPELQTMSLWALKHLVTSAPNEIKMSCLEELGAGWLIQTMTSELKDPTLALLKGTPPQGSTPMGMGTPNAVGEQVDILNAPEDAAMDVDDSLSEGDDGEDDEIDNSVASLRLPKYLGNPDDAPRLSNSQYRSRLKLIKRDEQDTYVLAWKNDVRIQEQALDFLRNLIADAQAEQHKMIENILAAFEPQRLFDILHSKIRPLAPAQLERKLPQPHGKHPALTTPGSRLASKQTPALQASPYASLRSSTSTAQPQVTTPPDILLSTLFILVHIANGRPSQRTLLLSQTPLIQSTLLLFSHPDRRIRVACVWLAHNLLWLDSNSGEDQQSARARARALREVGVEDRVRACLGDEDLDVKERAKGVVDNFERLLGIGIEEGGRSSPRESGGMMTSSAIGSLDGRRSHSARAWER